MLPIGFFNRLSITQALSQFQLVVECKAYTVNPCEAVGLSPKIYKHDISVSKIPSSLAFQNAGAIIGKAGANIKRLRSDVSAAFYTIHFYVSKETIVCV